MNKLESRYAAKLELDRQFGDVLWYAYEPVRLLLAKGAWYKPDFMVLSKDGLTHFVECKGFWRAAARVRIKVAADKYPYRFVAVQWIGGEWAYEEFGNDARDGASVD